jgi:hypothetical protein
MFRAVIALLVLFAVPATAGPPQQRFPKWWQGQQAKELGLTTEQSNSGDRTTETDVIQKLIQVQAASNEINRQFVLMLFREYRELRPDQRVKVKEMFDRRDQDRRGRGRGDPPRPPIKK